MEITWLQSTTYNKILVLMLGVSTFYSIVEDEEVIDTLPPDDELIKKMEKENKEAVVAGVAASEGQQSTEKGVLKKTKGQKHLNVGL
ncbi:hypothetical protein GOP47_0000132 [Adiantum capillus-veneris]|uniref:Uncharacterized protein n=1 Tax=Adiantum capillus-veneris TaxID=13818 RepID=A0A9D4ZQF5_ADICA|nr:hypothetical protein GOP47_0000132 [Adiantum capillus-veneris]